MTRNLSQNSNKSSFTLIELLVTLAIVAVLSVVVILTLNPSELLKQARDSNRLSDLSTINTALNLFSSDVVGGFMGTSTIVYVSIPDNASSACGSLGLPTLPSGWTYNCVTTQNLRNTDGTGWIPVNFQRISSNTPISQLSVDPVNTTSSGNYYTYVTGGSWMLSAIPESQKQKTELSNNPHIQNYPGVIGVGNNLSLSPLYNSSGLVGCWKFDENILDSSGNNRNGTWSGASTVRYSVGKIGSASGYFNGANDNVDIGTNFNPMTSSSVTIVSWINPSSSLNGNGYIVTKGSDGTNNSYGSMIYLPGQNAANSAMMVRGNSAVWATSPQGSVSFGYWIQIVGVVVGNNIYIYQNGILVGSSSFSNNISSSNQSFWIGGQNRPGYNYRFPGLIDDVRIYNRALSAAEILALYNATK